MHNFAKTTGDIDRGNCIIELLRLIVWITIYILNEQTYVVKFILFNSDLSWPLPFYLERASRNMKFSSSLHFVHYSFLFAIVILFIVFTYSLWLSPLLLCRIRSQFTISYLILSYLSFLSKVRIQTALSWYLQWRSKHKWWPSGRQIDR